MLNDPLKLPFYQDLLAEHAAWLGPTQRRRWEQHVQNNAATAIVEAGIRRFLQEHVTVHPHDLTRGGPDFRCVAGTDEFFVESTAITLDKAIKVTKLPEEFDGPMHYRPLCSAITDKADEKGKQLRGLEKPVLLAIGTLHKVAGSVAFSEPHLEWLLRGRPLESGIVNHDEDPFAREHAGLVFAQRTNDQTWEPARRYISGILTLGLGSAAPYGRGVLHPQPRMAFDSRWLPGVPFCEYSDWPRTVEALTWTGA